MCANAKLKLISKLTVVSCKYSGENILISKLGNEEKL